MRPGSEQRYRREELLLTAEMGRYQCAVGGEAGKFRSPKFLELTKHSSHFAAASAVLITCGVDARDQVGVVSAGGTHT